MPGGRHSAMYKALACHAGGQGSNPDTTKDFSAPIPSGKKRAVPSVRQSTDVRAMYGRKG